MNPLSEELRYPVKQLYRIAINYERLDGCLMDSFSTGVFQRNVC